jgi:hypothetical protein
LAETRRNPFKFTVDLGVGSEIGLGVR